jgi:uncharacterized DUF497 family protein
MSAEVSGIEFDWDAQNTRHLERHGVTPSEFEQLISADPMYLEYQAQDGEERYKVLGATKMGRVLIGIWTPRNGKTRAVTAYAAGRELRDFYWNSK